MCNDVDESGAELAENRLATTVIGAAIEVQRQLGPGLIESAYELALLHELELLGLSCISQQRLDVNYKGLCIPNAYRLDLVVEDSVIVEIKAVEQLHKVHEAQLLTYLRFTGKRLGLLFNFHAVPLRTGIRRVANNL